MVKINTSTYNILRNAKDPCSAEKDYLECAILQELFNSNYIGDNFVFAGGGSLSKAYKLSNRICQDIDLVCQTFDDIPDDHSRKQLEKFKKGFKHNVFRELKRRIGEIMKKDQQFVIMSDHDWGQLKNIEQFMSSPTLHLMYKSEFSPNLGHLCIEIIPRKYPDTSLEYKTISPYALECPIDGVRTVRYEQTFWDKVYALHSNSVAERPHFSQFFSRHYYDVAKLSRYVNLGATQQMLRDIEHHQAKYTMKHIEPLPTLGDVQLLSDDETLTKLGADYNQMADRFMGIREEWQTIVRDLQNLKTQLKTL